MLADAERRGKSSAGNGRSLRRHRGAGPAPPNSLARSRPAERGREEKGCRAVEARRAPVRRGPLPRRGSTPPAPPRGSWPRPPPPWGRAPGRGRRHGRGADRAAAGEGREGGRPLGVGAAGEGWGAARPPPGTGPRCRPAAPRALAAIQPGREGGGGMGGGRRRPELRGAAAIPSSAPTASLAPERRKARRGGGGVEERHRRGRVGGWGRERGGREGATRQG